MEWEHDERTANVRTWFNNHEITSYDILVTPTRNIKYEIIEFRAPNTYDYYVKFIICGGYLYVSGDIGDAIFQWHHTLTWEWLAGLDFMYMMKKSRAVERGNDGKEWIADKARLWLRQYVSDKISNDMDNNNNSFTKTINGTGYILDWDDLTQSAQNKLIDLEIAANDFDCVNLDEYNFRELLQDNSDYFTDYYEYGEVGRVYDVSMYAYWQALKFIGEKLKEKEQMLIV